MDELNALPLRSQVAFAARCARRVRHLFKHDGQGDPNAEVLVERAVESAEYFATGRTFLEVADAYKEDPSEASPQTNFRVASGI